MTERSRGRHYELDQIHPDAAGHILDSILRADDRPGPPYVHTFTLPEVIYPEEPRGRIIIRWPSGTPLTGWQTEIIDADTGEPITTAMRGNLVVSFDPDSLVTATLTMFADADGEPILNGAPVLGDDGEVRTGTFTYVVDRIEAPAHQC